MTVYLIGNGFKYETEAVLKLFYPVIPFDFAELCCGAPAPENSPSIVISRNVNGREAELYVLASTEGKRVFKSFSLSTDTPDYEHACELTLCRLLFECLREITNTVPEWGLLTGVRPVKLVSRLKNSGMSDENIEKYLGEKCYVAPKKVRLACETSDNQSRVIESLPKNSVSLYISIPFCPSRCAYCSFVSQTVESFYRLMPEYTKMLSREIELTAEAVNNLGLRLDTVYFGGGTPTSLSAEDLDMLMKKISSCFDISMLREYTVEAGRPDTVTPEKLKVIKDNGGDRVSVNPQTLIQSVLDAARRKHTVGEFFEAYETARQTGFKAVNVDLIAGLPSDTLTGFKYSLESVISLAPENITVHALSIKRSADMMHSGVNTSADIASDMIAFSLDRLPLGGYKPYYLYRQKNQLGNQENVGWERGGSAGIYNINMMEEIQTVLACGAGASTKIVAGQKNIRRFYNPKYPLEYLRRFEDTVVKRKESAAKAIAEILSSGKQLNTGV